MQTFLQFPLSSCLNAGPAKTFRDIQPASSIAFAHLDSFGICAQLTNQCAPLSCGVRGARSCILRSQGVQACLPSTTLQLFVIREGLHFQKLTDIQASHQLSATRPKPRRPHNPQDGLWGQGHVVSCTSEGRVPTCGLPKQHATARC